jgi:hypothetical protein
MTRVNIQTSYISRPLTKKSYISRANVISPTWAVRLPYICTLQQVKPEQEPVHHSYRTWLAFVSRGSRPKILGVFHRWGARLSDTRAPSRCRAQFADELLQIHLAKLLRRSPSVFRLVHVRVRSLPMMFRRAPWWRLHPGYSAWAVQTCRRWPVAFALTVTDGSASTCGGAYVHLSEWAGTYAFIHRPD